MSNGHSWKDIQEYNLSELGMFFKAVIETEKEDKKENLTTLWMSSNMDHKGFKEVMKGMEDAVVKKEPTIEEVNNDWRRLKSFMSGKK